MSIKQIKRKSKRLVILSCFAFKNGKMVNKWVVKKRGKAKRGREL